MACTCRRTTIGSSMRTGSRSPMRVSIACPIWGHCSRCLQSSAETPAGRDRPAWLVRSDESDGAAGATFGDAGQDAGELHLIARAEHFGQQDDVAVIGGGRTPRDLPAGIG